MRCCVGKVGLAGRLEQQRARAEQADAGVRSWSRSVSTQQDILQVMDVDAAGGETRVVDDARDAAAGWSRRPRPASRRARRAGAQAPPRGSRHGRSAWRSASRSRAARRSPRPHGCRSRTPGPPGNSQRVMRPGDGAKVSGFSALIRHSKACPRQAMSACVKVSASPCATRMPSATMSIPVVISVTGCSTWTRVFISMKEKTPSSTRNSKVPTPW